MAKLDYNRLIDECYAHESRLNDWEAKFLDDLSNQLAESPVLSERQEQKLDQIHSRVTGE